MHTSHRPVLLLCLIGTLACDSKPATTPPAPPLKTAEAPSEGKEQAKELTATKVAPVASVPTGPEAPVFDLVDNRHLAHKDHHGLLIDIGEGGAPKYIQGGWKNHWFDFALFEPDSKKTGFPAAYMPGRGATLRFPMPEGAEQVSMRIQDNGTGGVCDVFLGGTTMEETKVGSISTPTSWDIVSVSLPQGLKGGEEVSLRLHCNGNPALNKNDPKGPRSAGAIDWIHVGSKAWDGTFLRTAKWFDPKAKTLTLPPNGALTWYLMPQPGQRLVAGKIKGSVSVTILQDGSPPKTLSLGPEGVDLGAYASRPVGLKLHSDTGATLGHPVIHAPRTGVARPAGGPQVILVWLVDTLRADHLTSYNPKTDVQTPHLQAFAKEAALFRNATVQGNSSLPSSASIFTGHYPERHNVTEEAARLDPETQLLGQALNKGGWATGLFSANGYVSTKWGFARGFDLEVNPIRDSGPADTEYLWPAAKAWLQTQLNANKDQKIFLYINTSDPHVPYDPPGDQLGLYDPAKPPSLGQVKPRATGDLLHALAGGKGQLSPQELDYMRHLYKGEISYNDLWFGQMLEDLEALGVRQKTLVLVTSDHGEEFGEYGRFGHGVSVNQELVDVPLIVGYQPWTGQGRVIDRAVESVDIYPTLADAAGLGQASWAGAQGMSLVPELYGDPWPFATAGIAYHNEFLRSARLGNLKYQLFQGDKDPVYTLAYQAPRQGRPQAGLDAQDLRATHPIARRTMRDLMAYQLRFGFGWHKAKHGAINNHTASVAAALDTSWSALPPL